MFTFDDLIAYKEKAEKDAELALTKVAVAEELIAMAKEREIEVCENTDCDEAANYHTVTDGSY